MGFDPLSLGLMAAGAGVNYAAGQYSAQAQEESARYQADLLDQQAEQERETNIENRARRQANADRYLSQVFVQSANTGTVASAGTSRLLLEDISSRVEQDLEDFINASQNRVTRLESSSTIAQWSGTQTARATRLQSAGGLLADTVRLSAGIADYLDQQADPQRNPSRSYSLFQ